MKPRILFDLRGDCRTVTEALKNDFELVPLHPEPPVSEPPIWRTADPTERAQEVIDTAWPSVAGAVAFVQALDPAPVACVLWNTVLPIHAATALACKHANIPVFEVNHSRIATRLVGHFECGSLADYVVCSEHFADFLHDHGYKSTLAYGQPAYDQWGQRNRRLMRKTLGLDMERPVILKTSTWLHNYTEWWTEDYFNAHEIAIQTVLKELQTSFGATIVWTTRGKLPPKYKAQLADGIMDYGFSEGSVLIADEHDIHDLVDAADLVVSQKSGVAIDALMSHRPAIMVDFRPMADDSFYKDQGLWMAHDVDELVEMSTRTLSQPGGFNPFWTVSRKYWGGTGVAGEMLAEKIKELTK